MVPKYTKIAKFTIDRTHTHNATLVESASSQELSAFNRPSVELGHFDGVHVMRTKPKVVLHTDTPATTTDAHVVDKSVIATDLDAKTATATAPDVAETTSQ